MPSRLLLLATVLGLSACASTPGGGEARYAARAENCARQGGTLVPQFKSPGFGSGYSCTAPAAPDPNAFTRQEEVR